MRPIFQTLITSTLLLQAAIATTSSPRCRCLPSSPCWPTSSEWTALNHTISGKLLAVHPVGSVCHSPTYDAAACADATTNWNSSSWRGDRPGGMVGVNWEVTRNETCYITTPHNSTCGQGRVPVYSISATTPEDIQTGVNFARTHNLRLSIKNTGHDFLGRSVAKGSLQIWTHAMNSIKLTDDFRPAGCSLEKKGESAVTIGAGVQLRELYKAAMEGNRTFVAGFASTVGAAGGYIQGGGHSAFGPWQGMGSDNALEFRVVVADGSHVFANEYQNTDLYWALRGGGGGTFGVVTSVTLRTFPDVPMVIALHNFTAPADEYYNFLTDFYNYVPAISDAGGSGYHFMFNNPPQPNFKLTNFFLNQTNTSAVSAIYAPLVSAHKSNTSETVFQTLLLPSAAKFMYTRLTGTELAGYNAVLGSRLISRTFMESETGPEQLVHVLRTLAPNQGSEFTGHQVAGGKVTQNAHIDSAINPAWRRAIMHLTFYRGWYDDTPVAAQEAITKNMTNVEMKMVKALEPDMGAYLNEADPNDEDWQKIFWGDNYERLGAVKREWDPQDVFMCYPCVGAERWDREGICSV